MPPRCETLSIARRLHGGRLDHQDDRTLLRTRPVHDSLGDDQALARRELHGALVGIPQIQQQRPVEHEK